MYFLCKLEVAHLLNAFFKYINVNSCFPIKKAYLKKQKQEILVEKHLKPYILLQYTPIYCINMEFAFHVGRFIEIQQIHAPH